jgi:hypothetical protein
MEINITSLLDLDAFPLSHSRAEGGENAGQNTWNAAKDQAAETPLLNTPEALEEFRDHIREFGAWTEEEIAAWSDQECNALFLQFVAGDIREAGADSLDEINWKQYQIDAEAGRIGGRMFRGEDGQVWYYIGM